MSKKNNDFVILRDDREKSRYRWTFAGHRCVKSRLDTGDYTVKGYEDVLTIERKRDVAEIHKNLSKQEWPRFKAELERMHDIKHAYILFEFSYEDVSRYPFDLPPFVRRKIKVRGGYLHNRIRKIEEEYDIKVIFCGDKEQAINVAYEIMESVVKNEMASE